jgi:hypothetical protein
METYLVLLSGILLANFILDIMIYRKSKNAKHMWELILPVGKDNKEFTPEQHKAWEDEIKSISKDIIFIREVKGDWLKSNLIEFKEKVIRIDVVCNNAQLKKIVAFTVTHYQLEDLIIFQTGEEVIIARKAKIV